ncbi:GNAT family N-acetyltransferase [Gracilibacillus caseinilyticus]
MIEHAKLDGFSKLSLSADRGNTPAIHLYEKTGFKLYAFDGTLKQCF